MGRNYTVLNKERERGEVSVSDPRSPSEIDGECIRESE